MFDGFCLKLGYFFNFKTDDREFGIKFCLGVFLGFLLVPSPVLAEVEPWYTYWSIGMSDNKYPKDIQQDFDSIASLPGVERTEIAMDMLGFYWPLRSNSFKNSKTILGFVVSVSADAFDDRYKHFQVNQYLTSLSTMHFFG